MKNTFNSSLLAFLSQSDLLRWLKQYTETKATIYDKAMDANYNSTHQGGADHRLFDGSHDPQGAWEACKNASENDTFAEEVIGYFKAIIKDASTEKGMPFVTIDPEDLDKLYDALPFLSKDYIKDFITYDTFEVFSSVFGVTISIFALNKSDEKSFQSMLASMGVTSLYAANPIMLTMSIIMAGYAFKYQSIDKKNMLKSGRDSVISCVIFSALGMPVLVEFGIVLTVLNLINTNSTRSEVLNELNKIERKIKDLLPLMADNVKLHVDELNEYSIFKNIAKDSNHYLDKLNERLTKHASKI